MSTPAKNTRNNARPAGISDTATLRAKARKDIEDGAITDSYSADREAVIKLLNDALATEYVCADSIKAECLEHAQQEQAHAG